MRLSERQDGSSNPLLIQAAKRAIERRREIESADACMFAARLGIELDSWQQEALRSHARQIILNCSRQSGKSLVAALISLHGAIYECGSLTLMLSPSLRQSQELFRTCLDLYGRTNAQVESSVENRLSLELENGSRIHALPGKEATVRGFSGVNLLVADEAARILDQLYYAIRPMLAVSGGRILLLSTPFGKRGFFHKEWTEGKDWLRLQVTARECPRILSEWLEAERAAIGDWWYRQEYMCEFVETSDSVFRYDDIRRAFADESVKPLFEQADTGGPLCASSLD